MKLEREDTNRKQREFYDKKKKNFATQMWFYFRNGLLNRMKKVIGVERNVYDLHIKWLGDLSDKKVLDLGCYSGNALSFYLAQNSKEYLGIDLSSKGINHLRGRIEKIPGAKAEVIDFLSLEFKENNFDLIYAYGVLHHFKDTDLLIKQLKEKLSRNGLVISNDPLKTSFPVRLIRAIYRPFQSDRDWEWPFSKQTYFKYEKAFNIIERRGMLGKAKWYFLINLLPISDSWKTEIGEKWHQEDWIKSQKSDHILFRCMHLTMLMQKRD